MNKITVGLILGTALGALDGLSALLSAPDDPAVREGIVGIVLGSTAKGMIAGLILGAFARRVQSVRAGVLLGAAVGALLAALICIAALLAKQNPYWLEIVLPGTLVGLIVGFATQKYGRPGAARAA
jgi:hypothetical protein